MLVNDSITTNADSGTDGDLALGGTLEIAGSSVQGIETSVSGSVFTIAGKDASTSAKGVASFNSAHFSTSSGAVSLDASLDDLNNVSSADGATTGDVLTKTSGDWQPVSRAGLVGSTSVGDHNDVTLTSPADGEVLVMNGSSQFVNQKVYHLYDSSVGEASPGDNDSTSHTVVHNIGQKYCNVTVVDDTDNVVIPQSIVFNSTSQLTVTFNTAIGCKVIAMGIA